MDDVVTKFRNYNFSAEHYTDGEVEFNGEPLPEHVLVEGDFSFFRRLTHLSHIIEENDLHVINGNRKAEHFERGEDGYIRLVSNVQD
jgi:hypothetical protein